MDYDQLLEDAVYRGVLRALRDNREAARHEAGQQPQCQAKTKINRQCTRPAMPGKHFCEIHRFTDSESKNDPSESPYSQ